jgi:glycerol-1-phosphate dehydrogenase [NAD(P)+]
MIIDCSKYGGECACGKPHNIMTKKIVAESGCLKDFRKWLKDCGISGPVAVIYDTNTYNNKWIPHVDADQEIVLEADGLHTEKEKIEEMIPLLKSPGVIAAVGSGTITDFGRYSANALGVPFVSIPTLVSADGYSANICSIIIDGQKKSIPMIAATLVLCDMDIIAHSPMFLTLSGVCDVLSNYVAVADWKISHLVTGEYYCDRVAGMAIEAADIVMDSLEGLLAGESGAYERMAAAIMESGLTIQMLSNSRAASGAEHLIAHLAEMRPPRFEKAGGIHGECVGVGTTVIAQEYSRMLSAGKPRAKAFRPYDENWIREKFGPLADGIIAENAHDVLSTFDPQLITDNWEGICEILKSIPSGSDFEKLYARIGAKYRLEDIGIDPSQRQDTIDLSVAIRNRLTLMRMARVLEWD